MRRLLLLALLALAAYVGYRLATGEGDVRDRLEDVRREIELKPGRVKRAATKAYEKVNLEAERSRGIRSDYEKKGTLESRESGPTSHEPP